MVETLADRDRQADREQQREHERRTFVPRAPLQVDFIEPAAFSREWCRVVFESTGQVETLISRKATKSFHAFRTALGKAVGRAVSLPPDESGEQWLAERFRARRG